MCANQRVAASIREGIIMLKRKGVQRVYVQPKPGWR